MAKKILALVLALMLVLALAACGNNDTAEDTDEVAEPVTDIGDGDTTNDSGDDATTGMPNPYLDYVSIDEINEVAGTGLVQADVMGVTNESYWVIDGTTAEYDFTLNGVEYTFRASQDVDSDISGVYTDGAALLLDNQDVNGYAADDHGKIIRWVATLDGVDVQYVLYAADEGAVDEESFRDLAYSFEDATVGVAEEEDVTAQVYEVTEGEYTDEYSGRATASVVNNGDSVTITVMWADSADVTVQWTMTAVFNTDGTFNYEDCAETILTCNDDGTTTEETVYENGSGYFEMDVNGNLSWTGAADENCQNCVFVKDM